MGQAAKTLEAQLAGPCEECRLSHYCRQASAACEVLNEWTKGNAIGRFMQRKPTQAIYRRMFPGERK